MNPGRSDSDTASTSEPRVPTWRRVFPDPGSRVAPMIVMVGVAAIGWWVIASMSPGGIAVVGASFWSAVVLYFLLCYAATWVSRRHRRVAAALAASRDSSFALDGHAHSDATRDGVTNTPRGDLEGQPSPPSASDTTVDGLNWTEFFAVHIPVVIVVLFITVFAGCCVALYWWWPWSAGDEVDWQLTIMWGLLVLSIVYLAASLAVRRIAVEKRAGDRAPSHAA